MSIIALNNLNFNKETIRLSPSRAFVFKNELNTDPELSLQNFVKKYQLEKIEHDENKNNYIKNSYYGLISVDTFQHDFNQSNIKEIQGTSQKKGHSNEKKVYNHLLVANQNQDCLDANPISKPSLNYLNEDLKENFIKSRYFGIKRLQQELKPFSNTLSKKRIIKDLYKNISQNNSLMNSSFNYGFFNYNCLNFFNIHPSTFLLNEYPNHNLLLENSHQCALIYSNKKLDGKNIYPDLNKMTINFWINPKRTSYQGYYYNPGCIIHIPNVMSVWLIEDESSRNNLNQPTKFFIRIKLLDDANSLKQNEESYSSYPRIIGNYTYTTTNVLSINHWHNITINLKSNELKVYIDDTPEILSKDDEFIFSSNVENIFTIGNKINDILNENIDFTKSWFDQDNPAKWFLNQYTFKKQGLETNQIIKNEQTETSYNTSFNNLNHFNTKIYKYEDDITEDFIESFALNAELHNVIIVNDEIGFYDIKNFANGNILDLLNNEKTSFYLPCMYVPDVLYKQGHITLGEISNVRHQSFVNPVFAQKVYGHELSVEHFVKDLISNRRPYISGIEEEEHKDLFTSFTENNYANKKDILIDFYKKGRTINQIFNKYVQTGALFEDEEIDIQKFLKSNLIYRNNFILPCDNGLCNLNLDTFLNEKYSNKLETYKNFLYENSFHMINSSKLYFEDDTPTQFSFFECDRYLKLNIFKEYVLDDYNDNGLFIKKSTTKNVDETFEILFDKNDILSLEKNFYDLDFYSLNLAQTNQIFSKMKNVTNTKKIIINSIFKNIDDVTNENEILETKSFQNDLIDTVYNAKSYQMENLNYIKYFNSHFTIEGEDNEIHSIIFDISNNLYSNKIRKNLFNLFDVDISGTGGSLNINIKDNNGLLYRADCLTPHAKWNYIGHIFYDDGLAIINHPGLYSFGENNFCCELKGEHRLYTFEVNIPVEKGDLNYSLNKTYKKLKPSSGLYDTDEEGFVYITGVNLHDENLNVVARANFAQPIVKRRNDRYNFRLKMDY